MPVAYGSDRVEVLKEGGVVLETAHHKGWRGRVSRGIDKYDHPGTAVQWDDQMWEVVSAEKTKEGVRYLLTPWRPENVARHCETYSDETEAGRRKERSDVLRRERTRKMTLILSFGVGLLPAEAQERMQREYGTPPTAPTIISAIPLLGLGTASLLFFLAAAFGARIPVPPWLLLCGIYFFAESFFRLGWAMQNGKPVGSIVGVVAWFFWEVVSGRKRIPETPGLKLEVDESIIRQDRYHLRQPFLALLTPEEQRWLQKRYGFDPIDWGKKTAALLMALVGTAVLLQLYSFSHGGDGFFRLIAFGVNLYVLAEQLLRLVTLSRAQPAGSILGFLVRPLLKGL